MLDYDDLIISTYKKSNNTSSWLYEPETCVQIYHKPFGVTVSHCDERTQWANKAKALQKLDLLLNGLRVKGRDDGAEVIMATMTKDLSKHESFCLAHLPFTDICLFKMHLYMIGDLEVNKQVYFAYKRYIETFLLYGFYGLWSEESRKRNRHEQFAYDLVRAHNSLESKSLSADLSEQETG